MKFTLMFFAVFFNILLGQVNGMDMEGIILSELPRDPACLDPIFVTTPGNDTLMHDHCDSISFAFYADPVEPGATIVGYQIVSDSTGIAEIRNDGTFRLGPHATGSFPITISVTNSCGGVGNYSFTIVGTNNKPIYVQCPFPNPIYEGAGMVFVWNLGLFDPDYCDVITESVSNFTGWPIFMPTINNGLFVWQTTYMDRGLWLFQVICQDLYGAADTCEFWVEVVGEPEPIMGLGTQLWGSGPARPGFDKEYICTYSNRLAESEAEDVVIRITLPAQVQYVSCDPFCNQSGQEVWWNLGTVGINASGRVRVKFHVPIDVTPGVVLVGRAQITTTTPDSNLRNNIYEERETVVTSWDPNNKEAQPWGAGVAHYIPPDQTLGYTIYFENDSSATAEAVFIDIGDQLDPNLDWNTLEIGPMSHPDKCEASFNEADGFLSWHCDSIMLPPNQTPPEGEGFVSFSIKPHANLPFGAQIENQAFIRFDFNPWIAAPESGPVVRTIGLYGDANGDGQVNVSDAVFIINYVFIPGSSSPSPLQAGDANCDGMVNVSDAVYIINYVFISGSPPPNCSQ